MIQAMSEDEFDTVMATCKTINDEPNTRCLGFVIYAIIDKNPDFFENNFNIIFKKGCDDLDNYAWSALWLNPSDSGNGTVPFALQRYDGIIDPAINIMIPDFYSLEENNEIVNKILKEFNLDQINLIWQKDNILR